MNNPMTPDDITRLVCQKLQRFADCAEDGDGCDIGRDWFDALTLLGLLERTKRNPAEWTMTPAGHDTLAQQGKAGGVAEGYAIVPIEPRLGMLDALSFAMFGDARLEFGDKREQFRRGYDAMIKAAPQPPANPPEAGVTKRKRRVFVDMDGVIVDFDAYKTANGLTGEEVKRAPGAYLAMPAIPGAIEAVRSVIGMGFDVWIATKPPTGVPCAYSDKAAWIMEHLPELKRKIIITHDKGLLGDAHDFLCDDRPHKANCERFAGTLLRFVDGYHWPQALSDLRAALTAPQPKDAP